MVGAFFILLHHWYFFLPSGKLDNFNFIGCTSPLTVLLQTPTFLYSLPVTTLIRPLLLLRLYLPLLAYLLEHRHEGPVTTLY